MKIENPGSAFILTCLLLVVYSGFGFSSFSFNVPEIRENYIDVVGLDDGYIALTDKGSIDWVSGSGNPVQTENIESEELYHLAVKEEQVVVAGKKGALFISHNKSMFRKILSGTDKNIRSVAFNRDKIIVGTDDGELRTGNANGLNERIPLGLKGNVVSLSSGTSACYGVTDQGEIIRSSDSKNWTVFDFNEVYKGYYKKSSFVKVVVTSTQVAVLGENEDGSPVLYFSSKGNVWSERPLIYSQDDGVNAQLNEVPVDIFHDSLNDQFILLCNSGCILTIPSCSQCNKLYKITDKYLHSISGNEDALILVGDDNFTEIINTEFF